MTRIHEHYYGKTFYCGWDRPFWKFKAWCHGCGYYRYWWQPWWHPWTTKPTTQKTVRPWSSL